MAEPALACLAELTARLSADNERVARFADSLPPRIESVVDAAMEEDWAEVSRLTDYLSRTCGVYGFADLAKAASEVVESIRADQGAKETRRRVVQLVGIAGRVASAPAGA